MEKIRDRCKKLHAGYVRFIEKQGFLLVLGVCVAVIAGTAVWSRQENTSLVAPTPPVSEEAASAAQLQQEKLSEASTPTPAPTDAPVLYSAPLPNVHVLRPFDATRLQKTGESGLWELHDACDLAAQKGDKVVAMLDGVVISASEDTTLAGQVTIDHGSGLVVCYAGMGALTALQTGDPVQKGQTIGFIGTGPLVESAMEPHLHLRVVRNGVSIDPTLLWEKGN